MIESTTESTTESTAESTAESMTDSKAGPAAGPTTRASAPALLDFHTPRRAASEIIRQLKNWQSNICELFKDQCKNLLAREVRLTPGEVRSQQYQFAINEMPDEGVGVYYAFSEMLHPVMLILSPRLRQAFLADILDSQGDEWPQESVATPLEDSMLEILYQTIGEVIGEGWPGEAPLPYRFLETTPKPKRTRLFNSGSQFFRIELTVHSRFGTETLSILFLKEETEKLIETITVQEPVEAKSPDQELLKLIDLVPLDVVIELGQVELSMSQAESLSIGDVLILDQLVSSPLHAKVESKPFWEGVPRRIGQRQAFQITSSIDHQS